MLVAAEGMQASRVVLAAVQVEGEPAHLEALANHLRRQNPPRRRLPPAWRRHLAVGLVPGLVERPRRAQSLEPALVELLVDCPTARLDHWCQTARNRDGGNVVPFFLRKLLEGPVLVHPDVVQHKDTLRLLDG